MLLGIILISVACLVILMGIRNDKVYNFRCYVTELIYHQSKDWTAVNYLKNKHTYDEMMWSLKPLKLETWFTPEEITLLKGGDEKIFTYNEVYRMFAALSYEEAQQIIGNRGDTRLVPHEWFEENYHKC